MSVRQIENLRRISGIVKGILINCLRPHVIKVNEGSSPVYGSLRLITMSRFPSLKGFQAL